MTAVVSEAGAPALFLKREEEGDMWEHVSDGRVAPGKVSREGVKDRREALLRKKR